MESLWVKNTKAESFDSLKGNITTDVLIVGGGITGILCADMLKNAGVGSVLIEADRICKGITQNTSAKITLQPMIRGYKYNKGNNGLLVVLPYICYNKSTSKRRR